MKNPKYVIFDLLKIILSFLVINLHIESFVLHNDFSIIYFLGWYAVPLFIVMNFYFNSSKYLASNFSFRQFLKILYRFMFPLIFWSAIGFTIHPELLTIKYLLRQLLTGTAVDPPLYYLLTISIISTGIYIFRKTLFRNQYLVAIIICVLLLIESTGLEIALASHIPIQIQLASIRVFEFLKYGLLGVSIPSILRYIPTKISTSLVYLFTLVGVIIDISLKWYYQTSGLGYGGIIQFTIVGLIMISIILLKDNQIFIKQNSIISNISKYSLGIYCIHTFIIEKISIELNNIVLSLAVFCTCFTISVIISKLSYGYLSKAVS